ncbi:cell envelope integrity protein CreD [Flavobacterium sp. Sd200]|uniref:cell envelope integrity protein CreD n=1 Tax=Flavobacterium sp. Sd200 TaxID=2692211 RepID=UPI00136BEA22|nr:cell envelope integrity protein CreD [Flavobacterium sp. Sd200]MXN90217.1 cell envelope integrity protein CreD [Flavobacterium sp. Sd200]
METNQNTNQDQPQYQYPEPQKINIFQSTTARVILVGLLTLVLLIPLQFVKSLIFERAALQDDVANEIAKKWGGSVYFYGPVLKVPYKVVTETEVTDQTTKKVTVQRTMSTDYAYFFPEKLEINSNAKTDTKYRNNYKATVFNNRMEIKGHYPTPDFSSQNIAPENIEWEKASVLINTNNLKSIKGAVNVNFNGNQYAFEPVAKENESDSVATLETKAINIQQAFDGTMPFNLNITYDGSRQIDIVPIGKLTEATMASNWPSPSFDGNFLPEDKKVTNSGFTAYWKVSHLNRPFMQQYFSVLPNLERYTFDVKFIIPVDEYQQNERASKYGFLVIGLTFLIFFLIQSISKISIHIFQYSMVGLALIMFYTLLISITEHSSFKLAYLVAGIAVVVMIGTYSISILKNKKFPLFIATSLTALYSFIYIIIQLEKYALLAGSIGLFFILGAVMFVSRKIDWNNTKQV